MLLVVFLFTKPVASECGEMWNGVCLCWHGTGVMEVGACCSGCFLCDADVKIK